MSIIMYIFALPILVGVLLVLNLILAPSIEDSEKLSAYECGIQTNVGQTRNAFSISYWIVCILFLIFDLEIALFYPLALTLNSTGGNIYSFWIGIIFVFVLTVGFVYEYAIGIIKFNKHS